MPSSGQAAPMAVSRSLRAPSTTRLAAIRTLGMGSVREACSFVDALEPSDVGELVVGPAGTGAVDGAVFVERGRICWSAARGLAQRLTGILADVSGLSDRQMEELYDHCKERQIPLGEHLVASGSLDPSALRKALLQHTSESLVSLCHDGSRAAWIAREGAGYSPRFTFSTAEILTQVGANERPTAAIDAAEELGHCFVGGEWGAAFVRMSESGLPDPVALVGDHPSRAAALLDVAKWGASVLDITSSIHRADAFSAAMVGERAHVAFVHGGFMIVGETSIHGTARILNRRSQRRAREVGRDGGL